MAFKSARQSSLFIGASIAVAVVCGCNSKQPDPATTHESRSTWAYALRLGDSRAHAHDLLGNPTRTTEALEEYPLSGVTVWFSPEGRVTKFNFQGSAGVLYSGSQSWIPSDRIVVFGLTARSTSAEFARRLG